MVSQNVKDIITQAEQHFLSLGITNPGKQKWRCFVVSEAEKHPLSQHEVRELTGMLDISYVSPPLIARSWIPSICKKFMSIKYTNPKDLREFIVLVTSNSIFGIAGIIHKTPYGYKDPKWFTDFVTDLDIMEASYKNALLKLSPQLQGGAREIKERAAFSKYVNDPINLAFSSNGMTIEQIRAVNAFFHKYIPDIDGICSKCFKLGLPLRGPGIRWFSTNLSNCEIRLSDPKPHGQVGQQKIYITHQYEINQNELYVRWDGITTPILDPILKDEFTHLCWKTYDYEYITKTLSHTVPICQCPK